MARKHNERCKDCKRSIRKLLEAAYGQVDEQYSLNLPARLEDYVSLPVYGDIKRIHSKLQSYRGFDVFVKAKKLPNADYYIHNPKMIVEFDESQHFTAPRAIALENYPDNLKLGFSRQEWISRCHKLNKRDNDPPYRDEQRAWYDTLRDFASIPTVRLLAGETVWCSLKSTSEVDVAWLRNHLLSKLG